MSRDQAAGSKRTLFTDKVIESRICPICLQPYTPRFVEQETCGGRCARVHGGKKHTGTCPPHFVARIEARRLARRRAIEQICAERWPSMTDREREIFAFARGLGYDDGYAKGLAHKRRSGS